jgi:hypothetical protein
VTAYRDHQALETALKLRHALGSDIPVVVASSRPHRVAGLLDDVMKANKTGALVNIKVFRQWSVRATQNWCKAGLLS